MTTLRKRNNSEKELEFRVKSDTSRSSFSSYLAENIVSSIDMACRDRTGEFMSTVKNMEGRLGGNGYVPSRKKGRHVKDIQDWSNFMLIAKQIGKDISSTFNKLEKLTLLAKKRSLFDDKPMEIQDLSYIIKQDISSLNKQIAELQEMTKTRNYNHGKHMKSHSNSVVFSLQSKLALMSNDFRHVLELRTENLKHQKNRREQFFLGQGPISSSLPASATSGHTGSVLLSDEQASSSGSDFTINMGDVSVNNKYQQQVQLIDEQDSYIQNRTDAMQNIEATIVELGSIFQQLAYMVKEQEEMVQRIDSNVEVSQINVELAHSEILQYFQSVTSNRWLMIKIFAVLIVFFIIFVVFVA